KNDGINVINSPNNTIGDGTTLGRNVVTGNGSNGLGNGIELQDSGCTGNQITGNWVGLNAAGTSAPGNVDDGIDLNSCTNNTISGNVSSGNPSDGIELAADSLRFAGNNSGNLVTGNFLGTNPAGTAAMGNLNNGIRIVDNSGGTSITNNTVGGTTAVARNIIS